MKKSVINMNKKLASVVAAVVMATNASFATASEDFAASWDAADAKRQEAEAVGYEWRDTGKFLKAAKAEAEAGNDEKAMQLVARAMEESVDALAQAERESKLWESRVPK